VNFDVTRSRRLVKLHIGQLSIESEAGVRTRVMFWLPTIFRAMAGVRGVKRRSHYLPEAEHGGRLLVIKSTTLATTERWS
jgi:hypothetical protein